jgi:2-dehydropantoate 2-reductase
MAANAFSSVLVARHPIDKQWLSDWIADKLAEVSGDGWMRILVVGAGALGGYFGGCLIRAGGDVTFLVRPRRAEQLVRQGLQIVSPHGDFTVPAATVLAGGIRHPFDLILVGVKSYSLDEAMDHFAAAVGPATVILPILNGMGHLDRLGARLGAEHVLGGMANISAGIDAEGRVVQFFPIHISYSAKSRAVSATGRARWRLVSTVQASMDGPVMGSCRTCGRSLCNWVSAPGLPV